MRGHKPSIQMSDEIAPIKYRGICTCRHASAFSLLRGDAEDWIYAHMEQVERARSGLRNRTPNLASQRDYYREMAQNPNAPATERELWDQLARELDQRLNDAHPPNAGEAGLW